MSFKRSSDSRGSSWHSKKKEQLPKLRLAAITTSDEEENKEVHSARSFHDHRNRSTETTKHATLFQPFFRQEETTSPRADKTHLSYRKRLVNLTDSSQPALPFLFQPSSLHKKADLPEFFSKVPVRHIPDVIDTELLMPSRSGREVIKVFLDEWLDDFRREDKVFSSIALFGEAKLREAALLTKGLSADNDLCIAIACALVTYVLPLLPTPFDLMSTPRPMSRSLLSRQQGMGGAGIWAQTSPAYSSILSADRHLELRDEALDLFHHVFCDFTGTVLPRLVAVDCDIDTGLNVEEGHVASEIERESLLLDTPRSIAGRAFSPRPPTTTPTPAVRPSPRTTVASSTTARKPRPPSSPRLASRTPRGSFPHTHGTPGPTTPATPGTSFLGATRRRATTARPGTRANAEALVSSLLKPRNASAASRQSEGNRLLGYVRAFLFGETWVSRLKTAACGTKQLRSELERFQEEYQMLEQVASHRLKVMSKALNRWNAFTPRRIFDAWKLHVQQIKEKHAKTVEMLQHVFGHKSKVTRRFFDGWKTWAAARRRVSLQQKEKELTEALAALKAECLQKEEAARAIRVQLLETKRKVFIAKQQRMQLDRQVDEATTLVSQCNEPQRRAELLSWKSLSRAVYVNLVEGYTQILLQLPLFHDPTYLLTPPFQLPQPTPAELQRSYTSKSQSSSTPHALSVSAADLSSPATSFSAALLSTLPPLHASHAASSSRNDGAETASKLTHSNTAAAQRNKQRGPIASASLSQKRPQRLAIRTVGTGGLGGSSSNTSSASLRDTPRGSTSSEKYSSSWSAVQRLTTWPVPGWTPSLLHAYDNYLALFATGTAAAGSLSQMKYLKAHKDIVTLNLRRLNEPLPESALRAPMSSRDLRDGKYYGSQRMFLVALATQLSAKNFPLPGAAFAAARLRRVESCLLEHARHVTATIGVYGVSLRQKTSELAARATSGYEGLLKENTSAASPARPPSFNRKNHEGLLQSFRRNASFRVDSGVHRPVAHRSKPRNALSRGSMGQASRKDNVAQQVKSSFLAQFDARGGSSKADSPQRSKFPTQAVAALTAVVAGASSKQRTEIDEEYPWRSIPVVSEAQLSSPQAAVLAMPKYEVFQRLAMLFTTIGATAARLEHQHRERATETQSTRTSPVKQFLFRASETAAVAAAAASRGAAAYAPSSRWDIEAQLQELSPWTDPSVLFPLLYAAGYATNLRHAAMTELQQSTWKRVVEVFTSPTTRSNDSAEGLKEHVLPEEVKAALSSKGVVEMRSSSANSWRWAAIKEVYHSSWTTVPVEFKEHAFPAAALLHRDVYLSLGFPEVARHCASAKAAATVPHDLEGRPRGRRGSLVLSKATKAVLLGVKGKLSGKGLPSRRGSTGTESTNSSASVAGLGSCFNDSQALCTAFNAIAYTRGGGNPLQNVTVAFDAAEAEAAAQRKGTRMGRRSSRAKLATQFEALARQEHSAMADTDLLRQLLEAETSIRQSMSAMPDIFAISPSFAAEGDAGKQLSLINPPLVTSLLLFPAKDGAPSSAVTPLTDTLFRLMCAQVFRQAACLPMWPGALHQLCNSLKKVQDAWAAAVQVTREAKWTMEQSEVDIGSRISTTSLRATKSSFDLEGFLTTEATMIEEGENEDEEEEEEGRSKTTQGSTQRHVGSSPTGSQGSEELALGMPSLPSHLSFNTAVHSVVDLFHSNMTEMQHFEAEVRKETDGINSSLRELSSECAAFSEEVHKDVLEGQAGDTVWEVKLQAEEVDGWHALATLAFPASSAVSAPAPASVRLHPSASVSDNTELYPVTSTIPKLKLEHVEGLFPSTFRPRVELNLAQQVINTHQLAILALWEQYSFAGILSFSVDAAMAQQDKRYPLSIPAGLEGRAIRGIDYDSFFLLLSNLGLVQPSTYDEVHALYSAAWDSYCSMLKKKGSPGGTVFKTKELSSALGVKVLMPLLIRVAALRYPGINSLSELVDCLCTKHIVPAVHEGEHTSPWSVLSCKQLVFHEHAVIVSYLFEAYCARPDENCAPKLVEWVTSSFKASISDILDTSTVPSRRFSKEKGNHSSFAPKLAVLYSPRSTGGHRRKELMLLQWLQFLLDAKLLHVNSDAEELLYMFGSSSASQISLNFWEFCQMLLRLVPMCVPAPHMFPPERFQQFALWYLYPLGETLADTNESDMPAKDP